MDVVLDTNVILSATLWEGSSAQKLLFKLIHNDVNIFSSSEIISEYKNVLKRDFEYSDEEILYILQRVLSFLKLVRPVIEVKIVRDDPDDNKIIECAIASSSKYIITYDKHLLKIGEYNGIKILTPEELFKLI
ncbi:MAG: putative toxin-antitoxin system toxin component, PIN family [Candidatus Aenigmarchaeota archaeon]|nr:putative toxin-antitoxin system toxin component, PIN family [Candidatus Aenigmarchaeota archaeon]